MLANSTAKVGDKLILTKPIGAGIMNTAMKVGLVDKESSDYVVDCMTHLNMYAARSFKKYKINAATDITGFGMMGHSIEVAKASGVTIKLDSKKIPMLKGVVEFAKMGIIPEGAYKNMGYAQDDSYIDPSVPEAISDVLHDPQTSGGLLVSVPADIAEEVAADMLSILV